MSDPQSPPELDFDAMAADDEAHFQRFRVTPGDYALLAIFAGLFGVVFLQFFTRYVLNNPVTWTEEAARYLLIILAFAGAVRCQAVGSHIALEFMDKFYGRALNAVMIVSLVCTLVLFSVILWSSWDLMHQISFYQMVSLPFPKFYLYAAVSVCVAINVVLIAFQIASRVRHLGRE